MRNRLLTRCMSIIFFFAVFSCRQEKIEEFQKTATTIESRSPWQEDMGFVNGAAATFLRYANMQVFQKEYGIPIWEYGMTFGRTDRSVLMVPVIRDGRVAHILVANYKDGRVFFKYSDDRKNSASFQKIIDESGRVSIYPDPVGRYVCEVHYYEFCFENADGSSDCMSNSFTTCTAVHDLPDSTWNEPGGDAGIGFPYEGGAGTAPTLPIPSPCEKAKPAAVKATSISNTISYINSKAAIIGMDPAKEHGVVFGNVNGTIESSPIQTGQGTYIQNLTSNFTDPVADLHIHPSGEPVPSVGDLYSLINQRNYYPNYNTRYVMVQDGTTYALIVTDPDAMNQFLQNYPAVVTQNPAGGTFVRFPTSLFDEWSNILLYNSSATAMAFMLDKYHAGMSLAKKDSAGNFRRVNISTSTNADGSTNYTYTLCPN